MEEAIEQRDKALREKDEEIGRLRQEIDALRGRGQEQWIAAYRAADGDMGRVGRIDSGVHEPDGDGGSGSE